MTKAGLLSGSALCGALLFPLTLLSPPAHADVYHAVAAGDTLSSVAAKYHVSVDTLRTANGLKDISENSALGAMLLKVPGVEDQKVPLALPANYGTPDTAQGFGGSSFERTAMASGTGTIAKSVPETVRPGDTWESIAARYQASGHDVTVDSLRRRNNYAEVPAAGQTVMVPLGQVAYSLPAPKYAPRTSVTASAQTAPPPSEPDPNETRVLAGGVVASGEMDLPFAQVGTTGTPVYRAPNNIRTVVPNRGTLGARGGYGEMARAAVGGEVRVLNQTEEAKAPPAPAPRAASAKPQYIAQVARVVSTGAQIRRLPQTSAVSLFRCAAGTQVAVLKEQNGWSAILMSDRSTGWLPSKYLKGTGQTVDVSTQIVTNPGPGGKVNYGSAAGSENPMVSQALRWLGTPYRYGGTSRRGIDCSSLVQQSFAACGYRLPRTAAQQATIGSAVDPSNLQAGDRLYFSASGTRIDHTGLYMGNGLFVHASGSGRQVMVSNLFEPRNWNIFVGARR
jgi:cell wall-associated NlpC family hydrolase